MSYEDGIVFVFDEIFFQSVVTLSFFVINILHLYFNLSDSGGFYISLFSLFSAQRCLAVYL